LKRAVNTPAGTRPAVRRQAAILVEYLEFRAGEAAREYRLRVGRGADVRGVTVAISNEAFLSGRARYQDAPDICFLKIQRELAEQEDGTLLARDHQMTDQELEEYRISHAPKGRRRSW
jgi:hypothetical protein